MQDLAKELSSIYPCSIQVHIVDNKEFEGCNTFGEHQGYATYYRLLLARFLPKEIEKVLYLDTDMLAQGDIRECFSIDLGENIVGAVLDVSAWHNNRVIIPREKYIHLPSFTINSNYYFNSGFLLINLKAWRQYDVESQCIQVMKEYKVLCPDQDALHRVIQDKVVFLGLEWNVFVEGIYNQNIHSNFNTEEYKIAISHCKIYHYVSFKPWNNATQYIQNYTPAYFFVQRTLWWEAALQTPIFREELKNRELELKKTEFYDYTLHLGKTLEKQFLESHAKIAKLEKKIYQILYPHKAIRNVCKKIYRTLFNKNNSL